jgi:hypothetical protein
MDEVEEMDEVDEPLRDAVGGGAGPAALLDRMEAL